MTPKKLTSDIGQSYLGTMYVYIFINIFTHTHIHRVFVMLVRSSRRSAERRLPCKLDDYSRALQC